MSLWVLNRSKRNCGIEESMVQQKRRQKSLFKHARVELVVVLVRKHTHTHTFTFLRLLMVKDTSNKLPYQMYTSHVQFSVSLSIKTKRTQSTYREQNRMQLNLLYLSLSSGDVRLLSDAWSIKDLFCPLFPVQSKRLCLFTLKRLIFRKTQS